MKKVLSFVLALVLVLAVTVPAFATSSTPTQEITDPSKLATGVTNKVTGATSVGTLKLTVPTANGVVLNPYGLSLKVNNIGAVDDTNGTAKTTQIISPAQAIKSESTSKIKVSVVTTGTVGGNAKFATESLASDTDTKTNSVFLKFVAADPGASDVATDALAPITKGSADEIVISAKASTKAEIGTLAAGDSAAQYLVYQLQGDAIKAPTTPWTTRDTVSVTLAFTFDPVSA